MADKPIITHDFVPAVVNIREEDPSRFLGGPSLVIRAFKHEKDRIKVIILEKTSISKISKGSNRRLSCT